MCDPEMPVDKVWLAVRKLLYRVILFLAKITES